MTAISPLELFSSCIKVDGEISLENENGCVVKRRNAELVTSDNYVKAL